MNPRPVDVEPLDGYELLVTFQNGEKRIFDVKPMLSMPIYQSLKNKGFFALAKADGMCVYWNNDVDLCPDTVYTDSRPVFTLQSRHDDATSAFGIAHKFSDPALIESERGALERTMVEKHKAD